MITGKRQCRKGAKNCKALAIKLILTLLLIVVFSGMFTVLGGTYAVSGLVDSLLREPCDITTRSWPGLERIPQSTLNNPDFRDTIARIYAERPELMSDEHTEFERTGIIRDWVYTQIPLAHYTQLLEYNDRLVRSRDPRILAVNVLNLNFSNLGGFYCGGTSMSLGAVYNLLGYNALLLDIAVMDDAGAVTASHVVTIVDIGDGNEDKWIVQDATFNITYTDEYGAPLSYFDIVYLLETRRHDEIVTQRGPSEWRPILFSPGADYNPFGYPLKETPAAHITPNGVVYKALLNMAPEFYLEAAFIDLETAFIRDGYPVDLNYLFLYPFDIYTVTSRNLRMVDIRMRELWADLRERILAS
jgi:hypothetical protein